MFKNKFAHFFKNVLDSMEKCEVSGCVGKKGQFIKL